MPGIEYRSEIDLGDAKGLRENTLLTDHLNEMAQQGWRLHTVVEHGRRMVVVFERPAP